MAEAPSTGGTAAPTSAPSSSPSSSSPAPQPDHGSGLDSASSSGGDDSYSFMNEAYSGMTGGEAASGAAPGATPAPAAQPQPSSPEAQAAPGAQPAQAAPQVPPGAPQAQAPSSAGTPPSERPFDPGDPLDLASRLSQQRAAAIDMIAQGVFRLEPTELEALETDMASAVPKLMAKAVVYAQENFLTVLGRSVPLMIQRHMEVMQRQNRNMEAFWSAWPMLDRNKHSETVRDLAIRYRRMFPEVSTNDMIANLGPLILSHLGLPIAQMHAAAAAQPRTNGTKAPAARPGAFVPAAPGPAAQSLIGDDPFAFMGQPT